ncbi:hypothetical protein [Sorangium sp. So ce1182]|uniref:hypothetical protein n=1 Tax=Sorangium sp. So ce1182 TaxID=3133334 RepID=UPI003F5D9AC0
MISIPTLARRRAGGAEAGPRAGSGQDDGDLGRLGLAQDGLPAGLDGSATRSEDGRAPVGFD